MEDNKNEDINKKAKETKNSFFGFKKDKSNPNRKFLKYEDGNVKHLRERELSFEDILVEGENRTRRKLKEYDKKDHLFFALTILFLLMPIFMYSYYLKPNKNTENIVPIVKEDNTQDQKIKKDIVNNGSVNEEINEEILEAKIKENKKEIKDDLIIKDSYERELVKEKIEPRTKPAEYDNFYIYVDSTAANLNNRVINKLHSYFDNKTNRGGLQAVLKKTLQEQKNLYVYVEKEKLQFKDKQQEVKKLQDIIFNDIMITTELLELSNDTISKDKVDHIYATYE